MHEQSSSPNVPPGTVSLDLDNAPSSIEAAVKWPFWSDERRTAYEQLRSLDAAHRRAHNERIALAHKAVSGGEVDNDYIEQVGREADGLFDIYVEKAVAFGLARASGVCAGEPFVGVRVPGVSE